MSEQEQTHSEQPIPSIRTVGVLLAGMAIVAVAALVIGLVVGRVSGREDDHAATATASGTTQYYTCGMHPWVVLPRPGNCPICKMKLEPIDPAKFTGEVSIDPVVVQNIGVRIQPVTTGPLMKTIRTVGTVVHNEKEIREINLRFAGWVEKLHVLYSGAHVRKDDPLFEVYSPDLITAQDEYLLAKNDARLRESSRQRLINYGFTDQQIAELESRGTSTRTVTFHSPIHGHVIAKEVVEGQRVEPGMMLFRIADHSTVWVNALVYEYQMPFVEINMPAIMTLPYIPGQTFKGNVVFIQPHMDPQTRQLEVRLEFDNPTLLLKPGMYANIELESKLADDRVLAPRSAIIDTGTRQVAFVSLGDGKFEPRAVQVGVETESGMVEVRDGLKSGEMVVTSGQFLIDSEARVRDALARMIKGDMASEQKTEVAVVGSSDVAALPKEIQDQLARAVEAYLAIGEKLAADSVQGLGEPAQQIAAAVDAMLNVPIPSDEHFWHKHDEAATIRGKALELIDATQIEDARLKYFDLSLALSKLLRATGVPQELGKEVHQLHCPMYRQGQGGSTWLQLAGDVRNPYFGTKMLGCFDQRQALPAARGQE